MDSIDHAIIAGSGYQPFLVALLLHNRLAKTGLKISVLELPENGDQTFPLLATMDYHRQLHADIGISETDFVKKTRAEINLGFEYRGFNEQHSPEIMADAQYGFDLGNRRFAYLFDQFRTLNPEAKLEDFCLSAKLARLGRFTPPSKNAKSVYSVINYGYRLPKTTYRDYLKQKLQADGVPCFTSDISEVVKTEQGDIAGIRLATGELLQGDLFVDASADSCLKQSLYDVADVKPYFPRSLTPRLRTETLSINERYPYAGIYCDDDELTLSSHCNAQQYRIFIALNESGTERQTEFFTLLQPWVKNCIVLGEGLLRRVPMLIDNIHIDQEAVLKLVELWPRRDNMAVAARIFNIHMDSKIQQLKELDCLHLARAFHREDELPQHIKHKQELYSRTGKVAYYEKEILQQVQWPVVFNCLGVVPQETDLSLYDMDHHWLQKELLKIQSTFAKAAAAAPQYHAFIESVHG